jgi:peptide deformylase
MLAIIKYGHPGLRQVAVRVAEITPEIQQLAAHLIETMHTAHGVGLAAEQVNRALQMFVIDVRDVKDRPSWLERDGLQVEVAAFMPMVLINPEVKPYGPPATGPEGCLSFPELFAEITRPEATEVTATNEHGETTSFRCGGLLARAIQHEYDHLRGVLFIDRMSAEIKRGLRAELDQLQADTRAALAQARRSG